MRRSTYISAKPLHRQHGVAAVEFALIAGLLFSLVFGIFEMGRVLFYFNSAGEVTAIGARIASVCSVNDPIIKARMQEILPILDNDDIDVTYQTIPEPACVVSATSDCISSVTVAIAGGVTINTFIPYVPIPPIQLPAFRTQLRREGLDSTNNPACV